MGLFWSSSKHPMREKLLGKQRSVLRTGDIILGSLTYTEQVCMDSWIPWAIMAIVVSPTHVYDGHVVMSLDVYVDPRRTYIYRPLDTVRDHMFDANLEYAIKHARDGRPTQNVTDVLFELELINDTRKTTFEPHHFSSEYVTDILKHYGQNQPLEYTFTLDSF